jgi:hypothetical protein
MIVFKNLLEQIRLENSSFLLLSFFIFFTSCNSSYTPKPRGYYKITLPQRGYQRYE